MNPRPTFTVVRIDAQDARAVFTTTTAPAAGTYLRLCERRAQPGVTYVLREGTPEHAVLQALEEATQCSTH